MKKVLLALLVLCFAVDNALAGSIAFQVVRTGQSTVSRTFTMSDADVDRLVAAYQARANVAVNGTASRTQVIMFWFSSVMDATKQSVASTERQNAIDALPVTPPIDPQ